jgi:hypothetical protein
VQPDRRLDIFSRYKGDPQLATPAGLRA